MKALLCAAKERLLLPDTLKPFCVVVVFEGFEARRRAMVVEAHLIQQFEEEFVFETHEWRFDQLSPNDHGPEAARVAAAADLVIFASSKEELPNNIKLWIEMWLANRGEQETALAAIIGTPTPQAKPTTLAHLYLEKVANETGMTYFPAQFKICKQIEPCSMKTIVARAEAVTPLLEEILHHRYIPPPMRWGINE
jgi:hypothetical protein